MLIKKAADIPSSEITAKDRYVNRRQFMAGAAALTAGAAALTAGVALSPLGALQAEAGTKIPGVIKGPFSTDEKQTPYKDITNYNNFYEFSTDKYEPAKLVTNF